MTKKIFKPLAVIVIILLTGIAFQPVVSTNEFKEELKPNRYLFDTIINIIKNPKIKNLFSQMKQEEISYSTNFITILKKILIKKPSLLVSIFFFKPTITNNYLNSAYNKGFKTINILGEDESNEIISLVKTSKSDVINDITSIILNDEELYKKILKLRITNSEIKPDDSFASTPILCTVFTSLTVFCVLGALIVKDIAKLIPDGSQLRDMLLNMVSPLIDIALIFASIASIFGCWDDWPGP